MDEQRKRGGQPGNRNARKHGYYSKIFNKKERADYFSAADVEGIDEEIALLRRVIKNFASSPDEKQALILVRATGALNRLIRTRLKILPGRYDGLQDAIRGVVENVLKPMGVNIGSAIITRRNTNGTNNGRDEADLP